MAQDLSLRSRLARFTSNRSGPSELDPVLKALRQFHPKSDVKVLQRAYEVSAYLHRDQLRRSGEPYITHPIAVALILAELGMTVPTLAAALLHDAVEDTEYSLDELREDFGAEIAALVDGVTKLDRVKYGETSAAETVRKMVIAMARDVRVLVVKLADRLHNMRTLRYMPIDKQEKKARETLEIYAPLAHRLGMNAMKLLGGKSKGGKDEDEEYDGPLSKFKYDPSRYVPGTVTPPTPYKPVYKDYRMAGGGVVELMSDQNAIGANTGYPMADINKGAYATPYQQPISRNVLTGASDTGVNPMTGEMQFAGGGIADLGGYSDGGRMLKGPGDGMSDNIPATIAGKQPARLANEEFVIPADVVSHLGNGSSEAGAKQLYKMMDRVRQARTGKKAQGKQIKAAKLMPA